MRGPKIPALPESIIARLRQTGPNSCIVDNKNRFIGGVLPDGKIISPRDKEEAWFTRLTHQNQTLTDLEEAHLRFLVEQLSGLEPDHYLAMEEEVIGGKLPDGTVILYDDKRMIWFDEERYAFT